MNKQWLLLTNDDGIEEPVFLKLVEALNNAGHPIVVFAPAENHSATGMRLNLGKPLKFANREDLRMKMQIDENVPLQLFSLDGTPCDCIIAALDGGLELKVPGVVPALVVSGINVGPNMSQDSWHSGTMAAAREAGLYGMPAMASSWSSFDPEGIELGITATLELVNHVLSILPNQATNICRKIVDSSSAQYTSWPNESEMPEPMSTLKKAFIAGDIMLNLNVPIDWTGEYKSTRLGMRWYRNAVLFEGDESTFTLGGAEVDFTPVEQGDCDADQLGIASISVLPTWPQTHPLAVDAKLLAWSLENSSGIPCWIHNESRT